MKIGLADFKIVHIDCRWQVYSKERVFLIPFWIFLGSCSTKENARLLVEAMAKQTKTPTKIYYFDSIGNEIF